MIHHTSTSTSSTSAPATNKSPCAVSRHDHRILPPLEVCLYGESRTCPKVGGGGSGGGSIKSTVNSSSSSSTSDSKSSPLHCRLFEQQQGNNNQRHDRSDVDDENDEQQQQQQQHRHQNTESEDVEQTETESAHVLESIDSTMDNSRCGDVAPRHDISMTQLRKLSSQGIPDEGSWRGVAWRVLLGYLPTNDIGSSWPRIVPEQRSFYMTLVQQYLHVSPSELNGRELRGHLSKMLRDRNLRSKYHSVVGLDDSGGELGDDDDDDDDCHKNPQNRHSTDKANIGSIANNQRDSTGEYVAEGADEDEDLIDACIRHGGLQSLQKISGAIPSTGLSSSVTVGEKTTVNNEDQQIDNDQNHDGNQPSNGDDKVFYDSGQALNDADHSDDDNDDDFFYQRDDEGLQLIADQLPSRFREEWIAAGMTHLDQHSSSSNSSFSAASLAVINRLVVPQPLVDAAKREISETGTEQHSADEAVRRNSSADSAVSVANPPTASLEEIFHTFLQDANSLEQIRKDVVRTHQDLRFYLEPDKNLGVRRCAALERILFIWAKLNNGVNYVQGMNEIVGTLYYVLANDLNSDWSNGAEADAYFLFQALLLEFQDVFMPELDDTSTGIQGRMSNLDLLLQTHDPSIHAHLHDVGIDASFYALRWLSTLLSREFLLPDTIRLWDSLFSATHKENFLRYVCGTMVMTIREDLLKNDLAGCLRLLQSYPPTQMDDLLDSSKALWLYESQITLAVTKGGISLQQALQAISPPPTIVFAFGLQGGVPPPTTSEVVQEKAHQTREKAQQTAVAAAARAEQAATRLFGRAKRMWNGRGNSDGRSLAMSQAIETLTDGSNVPGDAEKESNGIGPNEDGNLLPTTDGNVTLSTSAMKPRAWNRRSSGSDESASSKGSAERSSEPVTSYTAVAAAAASRSSEVMNRLWNRTRAGATSSSPAASSATTNVPSEDAQ